jgi:Flp pilus assembly protein TadD
MGFRLRSVFVLWSVVLVVALAFDENTADQSADSVRVPRNAKAAKAEQHFRKAIQLAPADATLYSTVGHLLKSEGLLRKAMVEFVKATQLDPNDSYLWSASGYNYMNLANTTGAVS